MRALDLLNHYWRAPPSRSMAARGQSLLAVAPKVTKNACPYCPPDPPVLALCGMRWTGHGRAANASPIVTRQRIYDRTTPRASGRAEEAFEPLFDRFAIKLREPECEHLGYACSSTNTNEKSTSYEGEVLTRTCAVKNILVYCGYILCWAS